MKGEFMTGKEGSKDLGQLALFLVFLLPMCSLFINFNYRIVLETQRHINLD